MAAAQGTPCGVQLVDSVTREPLPGCVVLFVEHGARSSDGNGLALPPPALVGTCPVEITLLGYRKSKRVLTFPLQRMVTVQLVPLEAELQQVEVTSFRTNSRLGSQVEKIEVLGTEDIQEENTIKPGNLASLLGDLSVIHVQQTSAITANATLRMQGLDGRYTQLLRDGLPLYEGSAGAFGILQVPPADLRQVEIVKGSSSTLYGGGAIGGLVNLISKGPADSLEGSVTLNQTTLRESNVNTWWGKRGRRWGFTIFGAITRQEAVDVNRDGYSDVPELRQGQVRPQLYYYARRGGNIRLGATILSEDRAGGNMLALGSEPYGGFLQTNRGQRQSVDLLASFPARKGEWRMKGLYSRYVRTTTQGKDAQRGIQQNGFAEVSRSARMGRHEWVLGAAGLYNAFLPSSQNTAAPLLSYTFGEGAAFIQDQWALHPNWTVLLGYRQVWHPLPGWISLPRFSVAYQPNAHWVLRAGYGKGYKVTDWFSAFGFQAGGAVPSASAFYDRSSGWQTEVQFTGSVGAVRVQWNQAFYYTRLWSPLQWNYAVQQPVFTSVKRIEAPGTDTYLRFSYEEWELYIGYNRTLATQSMGGQQLPFSPGQKWAFTLAKDFEDWGRFGLEGAYTGLQRKGDGSLAPSYWFWAAMVEKRFKHFRIVLNAENLFDFRQSRLEPMVSTSAALPPRFSAVWGPTEGRVINLCLRWNL